MTDQPDRDNLLAARSDSERHFYLMVLPCDRCQGGPFDRASSERTGDDKIDIWTIRCRSCRSGRRLLFDRSALLVAEGTSRDSLPMVNPTDSASQLLDVGQWLALFYTIISAAAEQSDRAEARRLGYEATLCLEEALKFYGPDSELPGSEAFFTDSSRQRFKEHPEQFTRDKLHQMREKLPSLRVMQTQLGSGSSAGRRPSGPEAGWWAWVRRWFGGKRK